MDTIVKALDTFLEKEIKTATVLVGKEYVLPAIAAQDHMIECAGIVDARLHFSDNGICRRDPLLP